MKYIVYHCCVGDPDPDVMDMPNFKEYLLTVRYNWMPDLDADDLIQQLPEMQVRPIYRSGNMGCCTAVAVAVPEERLEEWDAADHTTEIETANEWYSRHELVLRPDGSLLTQTIATMATVITVVHGREAGLTIVVPQNEHNTAELVYLSSLLEHINNPTETLQCTVQTIADAIETIHYSQPSVWLPYLDIPQWQNNWRGTERQRNINWFNFLTSSEPYGGSRTPQDPLPTI